MSTVTHAEMVTALAKPGQAIVDEMDDDKYGALYSTARAVIAEGSRLDRAKKVAIYGKQRDLLNTRPVTPREDFDAEKAHLLHMAIGIAGEATELLEAILDYVEGLPLDLENVIEELGDIEFYMEGLRQGLGITRMQTLHANQSKLGVRYADGYSDTAAINRADKAA